MEKIKQLRSKLLGLLTHKIALPVLTRLRRNQEFKYTMHDLLELPAGTLGNDLALYLQRKNFTLIKNYERHDCKHIILGYEMDEEGEARMQYYFLGNGKYSAPVLLTVVLCFFLMPEHWKKFLLEFRKGRSAKTFVDADFNLLVLRNTNELRKEFNYNKNTSL